MSASSSLVLFLLGGLALSAPSGASQTEPTADVIALGRQVHLAVVAGGPDSAWQLHVENAGTEPVDLVMDRGLLWLEVIPPDAQKATTCKLPEPLRPSFARRRRVRSLEPGARVTRSFDPRLYCFADRAQTLLVPGARVTPHFGWSPETKTVWQGGKRHEIELPPKAPFVAWAGKDRARDGEPNDAPAPPPASGLKMISGPAFVLDAAYAAWASPARSSGAELALTMVAGSDAQTEREATVGVEIENRSPRRQRVLIRRELLRYLVEGPDGGFECPATLTGPAARDAFTTLEPGRSRRLVTRLIEVCPRGSFSRPGLYSVRAKLRASAADQRLGFETFAGRLSAKSPALVRIRTGYRPFTLRSDPTPTAAVRPNRLGPTNMPVPFDNGSRGESHEGGDPAFAPEPGSDPPAPEDIPPPPEPDAVE